MRYRIYSIDDSRIAYKNAMRNTLDWWTEVDIDAVNGREVNLRAELDQRGLSLVIGNLTVGEIGVWLSVYDTWVWAVNRNETITAFEDDAILHPDFSARYDGLMQELPEDWDFVSWWVPDNQRIDYTYNVQYNELGMPLISGHVPEGEERFNIGQPHMVRAYQGYGNVAQTFSRNGSAKLIEAAHKHGIYTPIDCFQYLENNKDAVKGYTLKPNVRSMVFYDWPETTIHNTERFTDAVQ